MPERPRAYNIQQVLEDNHYSDSEELVGPIDFWQFWTNKFLEAGFEPDRVDADMDHYKKLSKNDDVFPEGEAYVKRLLIKSFNNILGD